MLRRTSGRLRSGGRRSSRRRRGSGKWDTWLVRVTCGMVIVVPGPFVLSPITVIVIFIVRKNDSTLRGPTSGLLQSDTSISFLLIFIIIDDEIADIVIRVLALFVGRVENADRPGPPSWQNAASRGFALTLDVGQGSREIIIHINIISGRLFFTHLLICGFEGFARKD